MARPPLIPIERPMSGSAERPLSAQLDRCPSRLSTMGMGFEAEEGPLWNSIRKQLYKSEVTHVKRLVGDALIQQNKLMWNEVTSLRQMLSDFQEQNDELSYSQKPQVQFCGSQHRDLLLRQAQIVLDDVRAQAESCGHVLEDLVPELRDEHWRNLVLSQAEGSSGEKSDCRFVPPATPSTRPSTASGVSGCSTPEPLTGAPPLPLGRALGLDELRSVAEGIREALEDEQKALLNAISEQMQNLEAEDARRVGWTRVNGSSGAPSTADLQKFVHRLQDLAVSPGLRTLTIVGSASSSLSAPTESGESSFSPPVPISGGASVKRLQALIAQRRRDTPPMQQGLGAVRETPESPGSSALQKGGYAAGIHVSGAASAKALAPAFDPFFDDPFAA